MKQRQTKVKSNETLKTSKHGKPAAKYAWDTPMWQPRRYAKINWKQEFKSLTRRDKIFPYISLGVLSSSISRL